MTFRLPRTMPYRALARASKYTVYVNKRSGVAHRRRDCQWLRDVPDGALRLQVVENGVPSLRPCPTCGGSGAA